MGFKGFLTKINSCIDLENTIIMKQNINLILLVILILAGSTMSFTSIHNDPDAKAIIQKMDKKQRGETSKGEIKMSIIRPKWTRDMTIKAYTKGDNYSLMLITAPARDKGTAFLKRDKEIWNWQPSIDRAIKLPPSMMMQSWMGSDFTNDDLVKQSSIVNDYTHQLKGSENLEDRDCYIIEMTPDEDAAVVWGKVKIWVTKDTYLQVKTEFYDEDGYLTSTMLGKNIKDFNGRELPTILEIIPADEEGHKTIIEQLWIKFDEPMKDSFFSVQNMKRMR